MKILLPDGKGYKANLHGHSTDSDGEFSPERIKSFYKGKGYSIYAYTDHLYMRDRSSLCDEDFVALSGYENVLCDGRAGEICKCYHLNFYSPSPSKVGMVGVSPWFYEIWNKNKTEEEKRLSPVLEFCDEEHSVKNVNAIIESAKKLGYAVVYNHPVWSLHDYRDYTGLKGLDGMEICNASFVYGSEPDDQGVIYDQMLKDGQRLNCFANDDNHRLSDFYHAYNVMYPEKLNYESVFECLKNGTSYASTGATLRGLFADGNKITVCAENARSIRFSTNARIGAYFCFKDKPLTEATFEINGDYIEYFRVTVEDMNGKKAWTRAYFKDEFDN
ncbi:MAG: hypothetical protein J5762_03515 [Clostridia bacterium]|nr:hypothetical protein [Clostridia bacterium]